MANIKFSQFTVGNTESDIDFVVGYKGANNIQISPANLLSATLAGYLPLTGGTMTGNVKFNDNVKILMGSGDVFQLKHDGTNSAIQNFTGNLTIRNDENDKDIELACDDGSGGVTPYMTLDGSGVTITISAGNGMVFFDNIKAKFGNTDDLRIYHDGSDSYIDNITNHLVIQNQSANKDIIFKCDDGSGGVTTYFQLDGSLADGTNTFTKFVDNSWITMGDGGDLLIGHQTTSSKIENYTGPLYIVNKADDQDIIFQSDDGSGGVTEYFRLDGTNQRNIFSKNVGLGDNVLALFGNGNDMQLFHDGVQSQILNLTGNLRIRNFSDNSDITFESDDGSGNTTTYFQLDGSSTRVDFLKNISIADNVQLNLGDSDDLRLIHTGTGGFIQNFTGDLQIQNNSDGDDILFRCDDGSGGLTTYFYLDGSSTTTVFSKNTRYLDNVEFRLGSGSDFKAYHSGTNTILQNITGNLTILNSADDSDIIFQSDDGSGGIATYFFLDGSKAGQGGGRLFTKFPDNSTLSFGTDLGDLQIYHDGSNSYITDTGTGNLNIQGDNLLLKRGDGSQTYLQALTGSSVSLYHAGNKKLETTSSGVNVVSGTVAGSTHRLSVGKVASNIGNQKSILELVENTSGSDMNYGFSFTTDGDGSNNLLIRRHNNNTTGATVMTINRNDDNVTFAGNLKVQGVSEYADNAAAIAAGLTTGQLYRTGDLLKIVH